MATAVVGAALSVVRMALSPFQDALLEKWAASAQLGSNVEDLKLELLAAKAVLEATVGREIVDNSALKELLVRLQELGYDAEDVLDELDYFRIQDELDGTFHAADNHAKGCAHNLALNAKAVGKHIFRLPTCLSVCNTIQTVGKRFSCSSLPSESNDDDNNNVGNSMHNSARRNGADDEPPKLRFNRVDASTKMQHILEQLRNVLRIVSCTIGTIGSNWSAVPNIAKIRPTTGSVSIEPKLYGRALVMSRIIHNITKGKYSAEVLTVIPIVGPGGIGKTTLAQHIYNSEEVQQRFEVKVWTCISFNFNANKLVEEIVECIPQVDDESIGTAGELIEQRLKDKRFLLVLDDMWDCINEDEWAQLLVPFKKSRVQGNIILVTTRFPALEKIVKTIDDPIYLQGLHSKEFKELFLDIVFGNDQSRKDNELLDIGDKILCNLKGYPLAAKTVGRLLRRNLHVDHWSRVLESKEWEQSNNDFDIMPALKVSYDYLPIQLQLCFSYCALFPQDYKFEKEELINFWIGLDVLHSSHGQNTRDEDIGLRHLTDLVNHGFFEKGEKEDGSTCYIIHDLLHDLARKVSSHECLSIDTSQSLVSYLQIPPSIRHLSINIDSTDVEGGLTLKDCVQDFNTLDKRLKMKNLRSLLLFGRHHGFFVKAFGDLFREANSLRVVFLSEASYDVEDLLHNFYNLHQDKV